LQKIHVNSTREQNDANLAQNFQFAVNLLKIFRQNEARQMFARKLLLKLKETLPQRFTGT